MESHLRFSGANEPQAITFLLLPYKNANNERYLPLSWLQKEPSWCIPATYPFLITKEAKLLPLWIPSFGASARIASAMAEGARCP